MYALHRHLIRSHLRLAGFHCRMVQTSVGRVHAIDAPGRGERAPLVLLHGLSASGVHFSGLLRRLLPIAQRVSAPDMPGHGFSDVPDGGLTNAGLRAGTLEALDELIDRPAVLFGSSMGGLAAIRYAGLRPDRVRGLVLCSPGGAPSYGADFEAFVNTFRIDSHQKARAFVDRFLAEPPFWSDVLAWGVKQSLGHPEVQALLQSVGPDDFLRPEELSGLRVPMLLLWGQAEGVLPPEHLAFFERHLPSNARIERPPHYGHTPYLEHPRCVARKVAAFLDTLED